MKISDLLVQSNERKRANLLWGRANQELPKRDQSRILLYEKHLLFVMAQRVTCRASKRLDNQPVRWQGPELHLYQLPAEVIIGD